MKSLPFLLVIAAAAGCDNESAPASAADTSPVAPPVSEVPIGLGYTVNGNPVVGKPVSVSITIETAIEGEPITLTYRAPEARSVEFPEAQATSVSVVPPGDAPIRPQQVTLVPQRDGRIFLTVAASIEAEEGDAIRSMSIPLDVAPAPLTPEEAGETPAEPE